MVVDQAENKIAELELSDTAQKIADTFQNMVMVRGYNAVSYGDLAKALGIRTASIHYHFPSKAALGAVVIRRYRQMFLGVLAAASADEPQSYVRAYESFTAPIKPMKNIEGVTCLCGVLGAEFQTLDPDIQAQVSGFFADQEQWLEALFRRGKQAGIFKFTGSANSFAKLYISALQGAMLIKKSTNSPEHFDAVLEQLESMLYAD